MNFLIYFAAFDELYAIIIRHFLFACFATIFFQV
jgi:hypothetical protein